MCLSCDHVDEYLLEYDPGSIKSFVGREACHLPRPKLHPFPALNGQRGINEAARIVHTHNLK